MRFLGMLLGFLALPAAVIEAAADSCPQPGSEIATDRPDTTNSSLVVPQGSLQQENGVNISGRDGGQVLDVAARLRAAIGRRRGECAAGRANRPRSTAGSSRIRQNPVIEGKRRRAKPNPASVGVRQGVTTTLPFMWGCSPQK